MPGSAQIRECEGARCSYPAPYTQRDAEYQAGGNPPLFSLPILALQLAEATAELKRVTQTAEEFEIAIAWCRGRWAEDSKCYLQSIEYLTDFYVSGNTLSAKRETMKTTVPTMQDPKWLLLLAIFPACSFAGLAALLRSKQKLSKRNILSAVLNSGLFGVVVAAVMLHQYGLDSLYLTIGVSILSGLGGNTALDFGFEVVKYVSEHKK